MKLSRPTRYQSKKHQRKGFLNSPSTPWIVLLWKIGQPSLTALSSTVIRWEQMLCKIYSYFVHTDTFSDVRWILSKNNVRLWARTRTEWLSGNLRITLDVYTSEKWSHCSQTDIYWKISLSFMIKVFMSDTW